MMMKIKLGDNNRGVSGNQSDNEEHDHPKEKDRYNNFKITKNKMIYYDFIKRNGPYRYHITITFSYKYRYEDIFKKIEFFIKVLNRNIFNNRNNKIILDGFCFFETSSNSSRCSHHCHILIKNNIRIYESETFKQNVFKSLNFLKLIVNNITTTKNEISDKCVYVSDIYDEDGVILYLLDELWRDKEGNFIKPISANGLVS